MHFKVAIITVFLTIIILLILILFFFYRIPYRIQGFFNRITIEEARQLAKDCKIKEIGAPHNIDVNLTLVDGTTKYLRWEDQKEASNLLIFQKDCSLPIQYVIE